MKFLKNINLYALLGCLGAFGLLLYYIINPNEYEHDATEPINQHKRNKVVLINLLLHLVNYHIGKIGVFVLLGIIGTVFLLLIVKRRKE